MPPLIALALYIVLLIPLLRHASAQEGPHTWARWVPAVWVGIVMTRLPSQWLHMTAGLAAQAMEEAKPVVQPLPRKGDNERQKLEKAPVKPLRAKASAKHSKRSAKPLKAKRKG